MEELQQNNIPQHIAIIMDGNGRWAQAQGLERSDGHQAGMKNVERVVRQAGELGVKALTFYAFSTENWSRPEEEISFIMDLPEEFFEDYIDELLDNNVQVKWTGIGHRIPEETRKVLEEGIQLTEGNDGIIVNFALDYGGRAEIVDASRAISRAVQSQELEIEDIDEAVFASYLRASQATYPYEEVDLVIRTSGEFRLSNFLLWQVAYSEFYVTDTHWPDFDEEELKRAIAAYQKRDRRFGGLNEDREND